MAFGCPLSPIFYASNHIDEGKMNFQLELKMVDKSNGTLCEYSEADSGFLACDSLAQSEQSVR